MQHQQTEGSLVSGYRRCLQCSQKWLYPAVYHLVAVPCRVDASMEQDSIACTPGVCVRARMHECVCVCAWRGIRVCVCVCVCVRVRGGCLNVRWDLKCTRTHTHTLVEVARKCVGELIHGGHSSLPKSSTSARVQDQASTRAGTSTRLE